MISLLSNTLPATTDGHGYGWQPLDGDMSKVRPVDRSVDFGFPEQFGANWFRYGRRVSLDHLPTRWRAINSSGRPVARSRIDLPDLDSTHRASIVSQRFREIVERFEPGVHQFEPFRAVFARDEEEDRPFFIMVPCQRVVISLDHERTRPPMRQFPERPELMKPDPAKPLHFFASGTSTTDWAPVFLREAVAGRHLFCTADFSGYLFVSADLREALEGAGLQGTTFLGPYPVTDEVRIG
jgi:hypothetical protein